jgi:hypothetical protein
METGMLTPVERWAARSKGRAFAYLVGLALLISACLAGSAGVLALLTKSGVISPAAASAP